MNRFPAIPAFILLTSFAAAAAAQTPPNPYTTTDKWGQLPAGRSWGATSAVYPAKDGNIWVAERCGQNNCAGSDLDPVLLFSPDGKLIRSFGKGQILWPHGMTVDRDGNVWITDARGADGKGHQVYKFSPDGKLLMTLGKPGVGGSADSTDGTLNAPNGVAIAPNGDIFVAESHGPKGNNRILVFAKDGKFLRTFGKTGSGPTEFLEPHTIAFDSRGRLFVGDRYNNRIQILDQSGKFIAEWKQFSRPSGIYIAPDDTMYVADSESNNKVNPGWKRGIYVGSAKDGKVTALIPDPEKDPDNVVTSAAEGVAADARGNIYGAEVGPRGIKKYVKKAGS
jgi:DNA-binding beta-propeller fold protein YncE